MKKLLSILVLLLGSFYAQTQDTNYVRSIVAKLCEPSFHGRGYVSNGDRVAAEFLSKELATIGAEKIDGSYFQNFDLNVNTYPGAMSVLVNGTQLETGVDYIINPHSIGAEGKFKVVFVNPNTLSDPAALMRFRKGKNAKSFVVLDEQFANIAAYGELLKTVVSNPLNVRGYVILTDNKLTWSVGRKEASCTVLMVHRNSFEGTIEKLEMNIEQSFVKGYATQNVIGKIPGKSSDSILVFSAHYDHLGRMGSEVYIPGANDNASGTAMLLDLMRESIKNPPAYDTYFIFFAAEEAGLIGSYYFVDQPLFDLEKIKFLVNLDLTGDAKTGLTAVNGKVFERQYAHLVAVNDSLELPLEIKARGKASNSDHHPFTEKGVPCFFIYTRGDYTHYHDVMDKPENLPLNNYSEFYQLIKVFSETL